ncbi:Hypothetical predicted protein [Mytilus galloprovincialis]|uniref:Uncharacterized protein n=1 Tax=Mytilus galloprovincialis TaxID=29158 RepID=A0A8B6DPM5_MYTGA|nr:Hypothetical predicted protein [Mytilus galloprovincialis]
MSLITHKTAKRLGLSGQDITLSVTKVGNVTEHVQSKEYVIPLTDLGGKIWTIKAYGMEEVTAEVARVDMSRVEQLFKGINKNDIQRPTGQVDILIGTDCCILMPNKGRTNWKSTVNEKSVWVLHSWQPSSIRSAKIVKPWHSPYLLGIWKNHFVK